MSFADGVRLSDSIASKLIQGGVPSNLDGLRFNAALNIWEFVPFGGGAGGLTFARAVKSVTETVNNSNTFQDDDELLFTPNINKEYAWVLILWYVSTVFADIKFRFTGPAGFTALRNLGFWDPDNAQPTGNAALSFAIGTNAALQCSQITGRFQTAGVAGDINLQWAQNNVEVSNTDVEFGSMLLVWETVL